MSSNFGPYRLKRGEPVADGLARIARGRAEKAFEKLSGAEHGSSAAAIHGARKDLKKLRSVLRLIRDQLGEDLFREENQRYRKAAHLLSRSRDAEVKLATLEALEKRFGDFPTASSRPWRVLLEGERDRLTGEGWGETSRRIEDAIQEVRAGHRAISRWRLEPRSWRLVEAGLARSYRRGRQAMRAVQAEPGAEAVHTWRKRAKDLSYQLRIVRDAWPELLGPTAGQAHELTDLLGDHHDLAVLAEDLAVRSSIEDREAFTKMIGCRQRELAERALELGERLYAEKPKAFRHRLRSYWHAWRGA